MGPARKLFPQLAIAVASPFPAKLRAFQQETDFFAKVGGVAGFAQEPGAVFVDQLRDSPETGTNDRPAQGISLQNSGGLVFVPYGGDDGKSSARDILPEFLA